MADLVGGEGFAVDASLIAADANKQRSIPGSDWDKKRDPETASRAVKEYLATLDDAAFGTASEVTPKFVSPSDPAAQWTGAMRGPAFFAYADNYLIDVKFGIFRMSSATSSARPLAPSIRSHIPIKRGIVSARDAAMARASFRRSPSRSTSSMPSAHLVLSSCQRGARGPGKRNSAGEKPARQLREASR